jgi:hypothetical protein
MEETMYERSSFDTHAPRNAAAARLVLLGLLAPVIGLGAVLWFFLPGGVAGLTYTPSAYTRQVQLRPLAWQNRTVTVRGYLAWTCPTSAAATCARALWLSDTPLARPLSPRAIPSGSVRVRPQAEASWHAALRHIFPGFTTPFPTGDAWGRRINVTGSLAGIPGPASPVTLEPRSL